MFAVANVSEVHTSRGILHRPRLPAGRHTDGTRTSLESNSSDNAEYAPSIPRFKLFLSVPCLLTLDSTRAHSQGPSLV
eukprot:2992129-Amphidinium_carterae.1